MAPPPRGDAAGPPPPPPRGPPRLLFGMITSLTAVLRNLLRQLHVFVCHKLLLLLQKCKTTEPTTLTSV